jgi:hypothetical protein
VQAGAVGAGGEQWLQPGDDIEGIDESGPALAAIR